MEREDRKWTGLYVALATPFHGDGRVDLDGFRGLVRHVVLGGADVLVPLGTSGESATIDDGERDAIIVACLEEARGQAVCVGTGHNATAKAATWTRRAQQLGAHGALVVTPYYNRPTPGGIVAHYRAIADAAPSLPIVVYNVPGRTASNLTPATLNELFEIPQVLAVKESSGDLRQIAEIARMLPAGKRLLSGDDPLALPSIAVGACGLVSVLGNVLPGPMRELVAAALDGDMERARELNTTLLPVMNALLLESNPIPLKTALRLRGICGDHLRLPLTPASPVTVEALERALARVPERAVQA